MSADCTKCRLHEGALTVCMPGVGKRNAPFLVVVGNPAKEEDAAGKLGSGKMTRLLIQMLKEAGYKGEDIRIVSAVRCLPNPTPELEEVNACVEYLQEEMLEFCPKTVIAVGDIPLRALCKRSGVMSLRGSQLPIHADFGLPQLKVWPVYSPSILMKTPNYRNVIVEDLRRAGNSFSEPKKIAWKSWKNAPQHLAGVVAYDLETDYDFKNKTGGDRITQVNVACDQGVFIARGDEIVPCIHALGTQDIRLVGHNSWVYDQPRANKISNPFPFGQDTMVLAYLLDEGQPKSLDFLASKYAGAVSWKSAIDSPEGSEELAEYGAQDAYYTLKVYEEAIAKLGPRIKIADKIIFPAFLALRECTKRGIYISQSVVSSLIDKFDAEEAENLALLQSYVGDVQLWCKNAKGVLSYKKPTKFNPGSPHQISEYFKKIGVMTRLTDSGDWSSDAKALEQAVLPEDFRKPLESYRHAKKMKATYLEPLTALGEDGRIHPTYFLYPRVFDKGGEGGGTASGRLTATDNALTLPREFKSIGLYNAPKGKILAEADYGSLEFRLGAWFSGAQAILKNYRENELWDPHKWFARAFYGLESEDQVTKPMRQVAKSANFSQMYGGYWKTMQNYGAGLGIELTQETCEKAHLFFHHLLPEIKPWWKNVSDFVKTHGYVETPTGRRRNFGAWEFIPYDKRGEIEREAVNMLPQSFGHDLTLLALANCHRAGLPINHEWHDAIYFELDAFSSETQKAQFEETVRQCMIDKPLCTLREEFGVDLTVPLTIEISYKSLE